MGENTLGGLRLLILLAAVLCGTVASGSDTIVNAKLDRSEVSLALLRGIYGMRVRVWPDGTPVRVFVLDDGAPEHQQYCRSVLRMYPYQLRQSWERLVYSGTGQPPVTLSSPAEMRERVAAHPGAIGYLPPGSVIDDYESIKVLHVR